MHHLFKDAAENCECIICVQRRRLEVAEAKRDIQEEVNDVCQSSTPTEAK